MIEVNNLTKRYGAHIALDHLSFKLEKGCVCGFLGPNGAGKSTSMNMITGYLGIDEGEVNICGFSMREQPEQAKRHIGYLPEIPPLYLDMTVQEYLRFMAELKKIPPQQRKDRIEEAMELVEITGMRNRLIKNLSKGFRQRVGLAYAVLGYPEIIILDEPTVGLDPRQVTEIRELIATLSENHTIIFSSHILSEVQQLCDHVIVLNRGKLVAQGSLKELEGTLRARNTLELEIKAAEAESLAVCNKVSGINAVSSQQKNGITQLLITPEENTDVREALFFAFAQAGMPILKMQYSEPTLEELFLHLTAGGEEREE